jgi:hypothetical protein
MQPSDCPGCRMMEMGGYDIVYYCQIFCHECKKAKRCKNFNPHSREEQKKIEKDVDRWIKEDKEKDEKRNIWF